MSEARNSSGDVIQPDSPRVPAGASANPTEYADKQGKVKPTPSCVREDGTPRYSKDGLTIQEFHAAARPSVQTIDLAVPTPTLPASDFEKQAQGQVAARYSQPLSPEKPEALRQMGKQPAAPEESIDVRLAKLRGESC